MSGNRRGHEVGNPYRDLYEVATSSPWMCTNIVATGSNGCSPWKQHHGSLADLRCQETGGVTRLVTHTGLSRWAERCFPFAALRASAHSLSMTGPTLNIKIHHRLTDKLAPLCPMRQSSQAANGA